MDTSRQQRPRLRIRRAVEMMIVMMTGDDDDGGMVMFVNEFIVYEPSELPFRQSYESTACAPAYQGTNSLLPLCPLQLLGVLALHIDRLTAVLYTAKQKSGHRVTGHRVGDLGQVTGQSAGPKIVSIPKELRHIPCVIKNWATFTFAIPSVSVDRF